MLSRVELEKSFITLGPGHIVSRTASILKNWEAACYLLLC